jgi:hypothetical protein
VRQPQTVQRLPGHHLWCELYRPGGPVPESERAIKYALLFIALTFAGFFLFEVLKNLSVHPVQYILVGVALAFFYLLLLSLSEHLGFGLAYGLSASGCAADRLLPGACTAQPGARGGLCGGLGGAVRDAMGCSETMRC